MISKAELEARLQGWAEEYGGGRYEWLGYSRSSILQRLAEHGGFVPNSGGFRPIPIKSAADEVDAAISEMLNGDWYQPAQVIRVEYIRQHEPFEVKRSRLRAVGVTVSKTRYYDLLQTGKAYLGGALSRIQKVA